MQINGWDIPTLQNGVDKKTGNDPGCAGDPLCDGIFEYPDVYGTDCKLPRLVDEDIDGPIAALPGCNPINQNAPPNPNCNATEKIGVVYHEIFTDVTKSHKYRYIGCVDDKDQKSLEEKADTSDTMTVQKCVDTCEKQNYDYAGLEYGVECWCGNKVPAAALPKPNMVGDCDMPCPGDLKQKCGRAGKLSLYKKCSKSEKCDNPIYTLPGRPK